jgi:hypothetical protein
MGIMGRMGPIGAAKKYVFLPYAIVNAVDVQNMAESWCGGRVRGKIS